MSIQYIEDIEGKLTEFFSEIPSIINIDNAYDGNKKHADFIVKNTGYIVEIKSIKSKGMHHIDNAMLKIQDRDEVPFIYGGAPFDYYLNNCQDKEEILKEVYDSVSNRVEDSLKKANKQIKSTAKEFDIKDPSGVVIFLNENDEALPPSFITRKISENFKKNKTDNCKRFSTIKIVIVISPRHISYIDGNPFSSIAFLVNDFSCSDARSSIICEYFSSLLTTFFEKNQCRYLHGNGVQLDIFDKFIHDEEFRNGKIPRYEQLRRTYRENRKYEHLDDEELLTLGVNIFELMAPNFLIGHDYPRLSEFTLHNCMAEFTFFLEENSLRKVDLKVFSKLIHKLPILQHIKMQ